MSQNRNDDLGEVEEYDGRFKVLPPITDPEEIRRLKAEHEAIIEKYKKRLQEHLKNQDKADA